MEISRVAGVMGMIFGAIALDLSSKVGLDKKSGMLSGSL